MRTTLLISLALSFTLFACKDAPKSDAPPATTPTPATPAPVASASPPPTAPSASAAENTAKAPAPAVRYTGFATPESVLYDDAADRYLVSNINGKPTDADNNGYISVLSPDGKVTTDKWISGGQNKIVLNAPKGMAVSNGVLYVADLDTVRMFDPKTGTSKGDLKIAGATFLNDVAAGPDGKVYVSDSGLKAGATGDLEPTGTDAVYVIEKGKAKPLAKDTSLGRPNGVAVGKDGVWVVTFGTGELYRLDEKGKKQDAVKPPKGSLDGLVMVGDTFFVSSWESSAIYRGKAQGPFEVAVANVKSPADIGFDTKRSRLLVPIFSENAVEAYELNLESSRREAQGGPASPAPTLGSTTRK